MVKRTYALLNHLTHSARIETNNSILSTQNMILNATYGRDISSAEKKFYLEKQITGPPNSDPVKK